MASRGPSSRLHAIEVLTRNNTYQHLESLQSSRQKRYRFGLTIIEGVRLIEAARHFSVPIEALIYSKERQLSAWALGVLQSCEPKRILALNPTLFADLSRRSDVPELMAIIRTPGDELSRITLSESPLVVVLDRPSSPGNIGSIIRSADALGSDGVIVFGHAADAYSPEAVSASMGSLFAMPTIRVAKMSALLHWLATCKVRFPTLRIVGADEQAEVVLAGCNFTEPTVLVIGNEAEGVSAALQRACDVKVRIPMVGFATSLNAACATTVCLYEVARQRIQLRYRA